MVTQARHFGSNNLAAIGVLGAVAGLNGQFLDPDDGIVGAA